MGRECGGADLTIIDAIKLHNRHPEPKPWIRRKGWRGWAVEIRGSEMDVVPVIRPTMYVARLNDLVGEWELVAPETILAERNL